MGGVKYTIAQMKQLKRVEINGTYVKVSTITDKPAKVKKLPNLLERAIPETKVTETTFLLPTGAYLDVKYRFEINPCPAPRMTQSDKWKVDPNHIDPAMRQRPVVTRYFAFRGLFVKLCNDIGYDLTEVLDILFIIPFPKSYSKKKRKILNNQKHQLRPDRDNYLKSVQDSFSVDDGFVWDGRTIKLWGEKGQIIIF